MAFATLRLGVQIPSRPPAFQNSENLLLARANPQNDNQIRFFIAPTGHPPAIQIPLNNTMASLGFRIRRALDEGGHIVVKRSQSELMRVHHMRGLEESDFHVLV